MTQISGGEKNSLYDNRQDLKTFINQFDQTNVNSTLHSIIAETYSFQRHMDDKPCVFLQNSTPILDKKEKKLSKTGNRTKHSQSVKRNL